MTPESSSSRQVQYFQIQGWGFRIVGIDTEATNANDKIVKWPHRCLLSILTLLLLGILMGCHTAKHYNEVDKVVKVTTVTLQGTLSILKIVVFLSRSRRFVGLLKEFNSLASKASEEECKIWILENQRQQILIKCYYVCLSFTGTVYCITPSIVLLITYFKGHAELTLPFEALYPYDYEQPIPYVISYALCLAFSVYAVHILVAMDGLFCWFVFNISAHFHILQQKLHRIATDLTKDNYALFHRQIVYAVSYHRHIIALTVEFRDLFSPIIFTEVSVSCLKICFAGYQLSCMKDLSGLPLILISLITIFIQLGIYCLSGERVKNASEMIADSIYMSFPWERMTPAMKRMLLLPLMRARRQIIITAFIFVVDKSLLVSILKATVSVTGLLSAINDDNQNALRIKMKMY